MYQVITGRIKHIEVDDRTIEFIASHERVDSYGEVIKIVGIDLARFSKNPVLLLGHTYSGSAVAEVRNLRKTYVDGFPALVGSAFFPDRPNSNEALADIRSGLLNAVSVGVDHVEKGPPELPGQRGITIVTCSLYEISLVTIPACATCLIQKQKESTMSTCPRCQDKEIEIDITTSELVQMVNAVATPMIAAAKAAKEAREFDLPVSEPELRRMIAKSVENTHDEVIRDAVNTACRKLAGKVD